MGINPHLLLVIFLPPLLFGDAMNIDTFVARRTAGQCLLLAGPGVVIGAFATGALLYYLLPYKWSFNLCVCVGAVLASTDPIAVVSLLKELGASPLLTMQIQGESLFNDAASIVLFEVAYLLVSGGECGTSCMTKHLLKASVIAVVVGIGIGYLFYRWIRKASDRLSHKSSFVQCSLTIACAYWSYLLADGVFGISGVVVTVVAGLVLADKMWPIVVERQAMVEIWHLIENIGNILVFFLAGMLSGKNWFKHAAADFLLAFAAYVGMTCIRLIMLLLLKPCLDRVGYQPITYKEIAVMTWGGLRGMVGLALSIFIAKDQAGGNLSEVESERILFIVGCIVALTLVVNAVTFPAFCGMLGIRPEIKGRKALIHNVARRAEARISSLLEKSTSRNGEVSSGPVSKAVAELCAAVEKHLEGGTSTDGLSELPLQHHRRLSRNFSFLVGETASSPKIESLWEQFEARKLELLRTGAPISQFQFGSQLAEIRKLLSMHRVDPHQVKVVREVFLEIVRVSYWEQVREGNFIVGSREPRILLDSVNLASDKSSTGLTDWEILENVLGLQKGTSILDVPADVAGSKLCIRRWLTDLRRQAHFEDQMRAVQIINAFIQAHQHAQGQIASFFGEDERVDTPEEAAVILESQCNVFAAAAARGRVAKPVLQEMQTASDMLRLSGQYHAFVLSAHESGVLRGKEAELLLEPVVRIMHGLEQGRKHLGKQLTRGCRSNSIELSESDAVIRIQRAYRKASVRRTLILAMREGSSVEMV
jgi:NhaP-type Na+/H+ or K+/H+ antiporter